MKRDSGTSVRIHEKQATIRSNAPQLMTSKSDFHFNRT